MAQQKQLYSCVAHPSAMQFFANNRIPFVCRPSVINGRMRLFFCADYTLCDTLMHNSLVHVCQEKGSLDEAYMADTKLLIR